MHIVRQGTPLVPVVRSTEASASRRFLKYYLYSSFNPFLAACPLLGGSVMGGSTVYTGIKHSSTKKSYFIYKII